MREMQVLSVKMEMVTLLGKGRQNYNMPCVFKCMKLLVKYFWQMFYFRWGHLRLELSSFR